LDVGTNGNIKLNFPDLEPDELEVSCALDIADGGPRTIDAISPLLNITRARVGQLEIIATTKLARRLRLRRDDLL